VRQREPEGAPNHAVRTSVSFPCPPHCPLSIED
jgi:hypothetical protein